MVADHSLLDEPALKALGSRGVLRLTDGAVQVVVGPIADQLASEIRAALRNPGSQGALSVAPKPAFAAPAFATPGAALQRAIEALGGRANISAVRLNASRVCLSLRDPSAIDEAALSRAVRAVARPSAGSVHLILGSDASSLGGRSRDPLTQRSATSAPRRGRLPSAF